jgi:predicted O-methyltransferase YrrM
MLKQLLPMVLRNRYRPVYQRWTRFWDESAWPRRPASWHIARERAQQEQNFEELLQMAGDEFGITQVPSEIAALIAEVERTNPRTVVEVGTHKGGNSFLFCHALSTPKVLIGVDLCVQNAAKLKFFRRPGQSYTPLHGDSQTPEMRDRVARKLAGRPVDFLFIDGDHSYAGARRDFELYSPLVRVGGLIAFHDIIPDHRTRYGKETGCYAGEVYQLWAELRARFSDCVEFVGDRDQDGFGIGVIRWPGQSQQS